MFGRAPFQSHLGASWWNLYVNVAEADVSLLAHNGSPPWKVTLLIVLIFLPSLWSIDGIWIKLLIYQTNQEQPGAVCEGFILEKDVPYQNLMHD